MSYTGKAHKEHQTSRRRGRATLKGSQYVGVLPVSGGFMACCHGELRGPFKSDIAAAIVVQEFEGNYIKAGRLRSLQAQVKKHNSSRDLPAGVYRHRDRLRAVVRRGHRNIYLGTFSDAEPAAAAVEAFLLKEEARKSSARPSKRYRRGMRFECPRCGAEFRRCPETCTKCGSLKLQEIA